VRKAVGQPKMAKNFEELIKSNQELNCIIIKVLWVIRDLIEKI